MNVPAVFNVCAGEIFGIRSWQHIALGRGAWLASDCIGSGLGEKEVENVYGPLRDRDP